MSMDDATDQDRPQRVERIDERMDDRGPQVQWGHVAAVLAMTGFIVWFLNDSWSRSARPQNLMLILPVAAVSVLVGLSILAGTLVRYLRGTGDERLQPVDVRIPGFMLLVAVYVAGLLYTGFDVATFVFVLGCLWLLGERNHLLAVGYAAALTALTVYGLREIVSLPVPTLLFSGS